MKLKLLAIIAVLAAGGLGFWLGSYRTRQVWQRAAELRVDQVAHYHNWTRASVSTHVLQYLADGKNAEARSALERQLDVALVKVVAYEKLYRPGDRGGIELGIIREARDYRSQHPWASAPDKAEEVQQAFKWAN